MVLPKISFLVILINKDVFMISSDSSHAGAEVLPKISVIVPFYNSGEYLDRCLQSIVNQSYQNLEIIGIDDDSEDNSWDIASRQALLDKRIKLNKQAHQGRSAARNNGLKLSTCPFVMFVDSDDELPVDAVKELVEKLLVEPSDACVGSIKVIYEVHSELRRSDSEYYSIKKEGMERISFESIRGFHWSSCAVIFKKEIIEKAGLAYPVGLNYEDAYWHWCYFLSCSRVTFVKKPVYLYFRRPNSIMSQTFENKKGVALQHLDIAAEIFKFASFRRPDFFSSPVSKDLLKDCFLFAYGYSEKSDREIAILKTKHLIEQFQIQEFGDGLISLIKKTQIKRIKVAWFKLRIKRAILERLSWLLIIKRRFFS